MNQLFQAVFRLYEDLQVIPESQFNLHIDNLVSMKRRNSTEITPESVSTVYELAALLRASPEQSTQLCQRFDVTTLLKTAYDARYLIQMLNEREQITVYQAVKPHLLTLINEKQSLVALLTALPAAQCNDFCNALGYDRLADIIKDTSSLNALLRHVTTEQQAQIYPVIKQQLLDLLRKANPDELSEGLQYLTSNQCHEACLSIKEHISKNITTTEDFRRTAQKLNSAQITEIYQIVSEQILATMDKAQDIHNLLLYRNPSQRSELYESFKMRWIQWIKSGKDLGLILYYLLKEEVQDFCQLLTNTNNLGNLSLRIEDTLTLLPCEQRTVVLNALKDNLPDFIKDGLHLETILKELSSEQRQVVFEAMKEHFTMIISDPFQLKAVLRYLSSEQCQTVLDAIKGNSNCIIKNANDFSTVLQSLSSQHHQVVVDAMKKNLPSIIQNGWDFNSVLPRLTLEQRTEVFEAMKERVPSIIQNGQDFSSVLQWLTLEQRAEVFESIKERLPSIFKVNVDLIFVRHYLTPDQCNLIKNVIEEVHLKQSTILPQQSGHSFFSNTSNNDGQNKKKEDAPTNTISIV